MNDKSLAFLEKLLDTPGPSGFETAAARIWRSEAEGFAQEVSADIKGNSQAAVNPGGSPRVMLAGHIDEIGLMIVHIDDEGFLFFSTIGGWDSQVLVGQRVIIAARNGPVTGVIGKKAIHLIKKEDRDKASKITDLWIDIGAKSKTAALSRVRVGDPAVLNVPMAIVSAVTVEAVSTTRAVMFSRLTAVRLTIAPFWAVMVLLEASVIVPPVMMSSVPLSTSTSPPKLTVEESVRKLGHAGRADSIDCAK